MVFITGDTHRNFSRFSPDRFPEMRTMTKEDTIIICGDCGVLWHGGRRDAIQLELLEDLPFTLAFVDGKGKVLVMRPDTLRESCWDPHDQLWYGEGGFGCSPHARGQAVYATCLSDGEKTRWNRSDFAGVLDEQYLPGWAREKLEELRGVQQEQGTGHSMDGMTME